MMNKEEVKRMETLEKEVSELKTELNTLREFVKALYSMMDEEAACDSEGIPAAADFRGLNT